MWFAHTCFALPFAVFLLHNFISQLPRDLMEAARVDGATHPKIFRTIVLPLITPALAAFGIFQFLWVWNDLLVALIFAGGSSETAPLTVRLAEMAGTRGNEWQRLTAGAFVVDRRTADRVPVPPALLRARPARGQRQGLSRVGPPPPVPGGGGRGWSGGNDDQD